nr:MULTISPECIES: NTP transferase domain-containing protein [unclassified Moraxella]
MGSPKALLSLPNGETLLDFHIRHAKCLNVPVMVADNGKGLCHDTTVKIIDDYLPNQQDGKGAGALSAMASAMNQVMSPYHYLLVISCDSLVQANQVFDKLHYAATDNEAVIYLKAEKDYPLLGLYRTDLLIKLKDYLDKGQRAVMKFLADKKIQTAALPNEWITLANFNTKNEFDLALNSLNEIG